MIIKLFAVFDSKAAMFGRIFSDQQEGSAMRNFSDAVNDSSNQNNMWNKHPEDFSLFQVGEFDDSTGELIPCIPKSLITASALKNIANGIDVSFVNDNKTHKELIQ